jgi:hypothetical protein
MSSNREYLRFTLPPVLTAAADEAEAEDAAELLLLIIIG